MGGLAAHAALAVAVASSCGVMNASFAIRFAVAVAAAHASIDGGMGIERGLGSISGNHVTSTSTVPCLSMATLSSVGAPGMHCPRKISPEPSESFMLILSWSHTSRWMGAASLVTLTSSSSSQMGLTVFFTTAVFSLGPPGACSTTYGSDVRRPCPPRATN